MRKENLSRSSSESTQYALNLPVRIVHDICRTAGSHDLIETAQTNLRKEGILRAVRRHDNETLFGWILRTVSYQGISDYVASQYMEKHGSVTFQDVQQQLATTGTCAKLADFTSFVDCGFQKSNWTCTRSSDVHTCPVPLLPLRNGRLNQTAFSLFFFLQDVAQGDLVSWIDTNIQIGKPRWAASRLSSGLGAVFGVSDKVASLALSGLLLACASSRPRWGEVGAQMVVVDTLVHNFLCRTGILRHLGHEHAYGPACYLPNGCSDTIRLVADRIDAREFNADYPNAFPRFVQQAIWRHCAELELNICNGHQIDDRRGCRQAYCAVFDLCCRDPLKHTK